MRGSGEFYFTTTAKKMAEAELERLIAVIRDKESGGDAAVGKVEQLLKKRPELAKMKQTEAWNRLPLHVAACVDGIDVRIAELLLKAYPQATMQKDTHGDTPLSLAVFFQGGSGGAVVCQLLLQYGPQAAMEKNNAGWLPLHVAAQHQGGKKRHGHCGAAASVQARGSHGEERRWMDPPAHCSALSR